MVWSHLADSYSSRSDKETSDAKQADLDEAVTAYKKAIELDANNAAYHNNYALILVKDKKLDEGSAELSKAASMDPTSAGKYYFNLGAVLANVNQNDQAGEAFKKSMASGYIEGYYQYGLTLVALRRPPPPTVRLWLRTAPCRRSRNIWSWRPPVKTLRARRICWCAGRRHRDFVRKSRAEEANQQ